MLLVPSISTGNVPQLALDLLIHLLEFKFLERLDDTFLYPFVSPKDYIESPEPGILYALELLHSPKHNLYIVLQRLPIMPGFAQRHVEQVLTPLIKKYKLPVLLMELADAGLAGKLPGTVEIFSKEDLLSQDFAQLGLAESEGSTLTAYGKQVAPLLATVAISYVYEGDNSEDAHKFARKVLDILKIDANFKEPRSWKGVYGGRPVPLLLEEGIYG